jgi:hypothetical protein
MDVGATVSAAIPVPLIAMVCVPAPSFNVTAADLGPAADGVNVTLIVHVAPIATLVPHVLVCAKLVRFVPVRVMLVIDSATLPVLATVTVRGELAVLTP